MLHYKLKKIEFLIYNNLNFNIKFFDDGRY